MYTQAVLLSVLVAIAEARFGQEQIPIAAISAVTSGGQPGQAATLAGESISFLLGAANPCGKLAQADKIIATLGTGADSIAAAKGLVAAEQNFNNFVASVPSICSDPTLPATEVLRGIVPLVDPGVGGSDIENANSAASLNAPFDNAGLSVADIMAANGFSNFTTKAADGTVGQAPAGGNAGGNAGEAAPEASAAPEVSAAPPAASSVAAPASCGATTLVTVTRSAAATQTPVEAPVEDPAEAPAEDPVEAPVEAPAAGDGAADGGADAGLFGVCTPTIKFEGGLGGRPATEFTFQATDPLVSEGQQEALNPNIITNRICDQLTNVCNASAEGKELCLTAKAQILASGARDATVVDAWNSALGF